MKKDEEWPHVVREVHLFGGGRAYNFEGSHVKVMPERIGGGGIELTLPRFSALFSSIESIGLKVVGCDFFTHSGELDGSSPPQWRTKCFSNLGWLCTDQGNHWSFIGYAAFKAKHGVLCDIAYRVSHQIKACEWRLRQLSESYSEQLESRLKDGKFEHGRQFANGYTSLSYLAVQSFLVDVCILRDYLVEFYWAALPDGSEKSNKKVTTMGGLLKAWKGSSTISKVGKEIKTCAEKGGWLFELGAYRDLVVHAAPLAHADKTMYAVCQAIELPGGRKFPGIKLPLPSDPYSITGERTSGRYFEEDELNFARLSNALADVDSAKDALEYAHLTMQLVSSLASSISKVSPFEPKIPEFHIGADGKAVEK